MSEPRNEDSLRKLDIDQVARIAMGATLLGAGGGGDPYISLLAARQFHAQGGGHANLIGLADLDDDAQVICVAGFGAPTDALRVVQATGAGDSVIVTESAGLDIVQGLGWVE